MNNTHECLYKENKRSLYLKAAYVAQLSTTTPKAKGIQVPKSIQERTTSTYIKLYIIIMKRHF